MVGNELEPMPTLYLEMSFISSACLLKLKHLGMILQTTDKVPRVYLHWGLTTPKMIPGCGREKELLSKIMSEHLALADPGY